MYIPVVAGDDANYIWSTIVDNMLYGTDSKVTVLLQGRTQCTCLIHHFTVSVLPEAISYLKIPRYILLLVIYDYM